MPLNIALGHTYKNTIYQLGHCLFNFTQQDDQFTTLYMQQGSLVLGILSDPVVRAKSGKYWTNLSWWHYSSQ